MSPYAFKSYRAYLKALCKDPQVQRGFQSSLAKAAGCQASYFSQVIQEKVHLTEDQALGISELLGHSQEEAEHFLLLLRLEKAGTSKLKKYLSHLLEKSSAQNERVGQNVPADRFLQKDEDIGKYCSSWIPSAVHLLTSNSHYRESRLIAEYLKIPVKTVEETLSLLKQLDFVEKKEGQWFYKGGSLHIPKDSPWQSALQTSRRQLAQRSIVLNPDQALHFSSVFTIDRSDLDNLKSICKSFLDKSHKVIQKSGTEELCCICLDYFTVV